LVWGFAAQQDFDGRREAGPVAAGVYWARPVPFGKAARFGVIETGGAPILQVCWRRNALRQSPLLISRTQHPYRMAAVRSNLGFVR